MKPVPDSAAPIVAWRLWAVCQCRLRSVSVHEAWPPRVAAIGQCRRPGVVHSAPEPHCSCGLHALREVIPPSRALVTRDLFARMDFVAFGQVALWGRVEAHQHGYRAQYAYPAWVRVLDGPEVLCHDLQELYGIPVLPCAFQRAIRDRLASSCGEPATAFRLAAAVITYHVRRDSRVPIGLVNGEGRWRPSLGMRREVCARCRQRAPAFCLRSHLDHYRSVQHIAAMYRVPAAAIEDAADVLEEIDTALSQVPS